MDVFFFNILAQNIHCGYTLEPPRRGGSRRVGSNEYPQCMFWVKKRKLGIPLQTPVFFILKWGLRGIPYMDMFS